MMTRNPDKIRPFPISVYLGVVLALIFCGIAASGYLFFSHYRVYTDISYSSFCAISKAINCDTVAQSPYSIFSGVPVAIWGIIGYVFMLITLWLSFDIRSKKMTLFPTLFLLGAGFSMVSIFLGILSGVKIHSYCLMCILTYGINFMLLYMFWMMKSRFDQNTWKAAVKKDISFWNTHKLKAVKFYSPLIVSTILIIAFIPAYWHMGVTDPGKKVIATGVTEEGDPWIGSRTPELTIVEYSDYMCFQCRKMHFFLRKLIAGYPEKIRLVHKHFPMDKKFNPMLKEDLHPGSGILSSIAVHAAREDRFWDLNDYLYHYNMGGNAIYLRKIAQESGLDLDRLKTGIHDIETRQKLQEDIISGLKKNISGTPSYIINDKVYTGLIPSDVLSAVIK